MTETLLGLEEMEAVQTNGKLILQVPWGRAEHWQTQLRGAGIGTTLHLDPLHREARLEPWMDLGLDRLRELLRAPVVSTVEPR